MNEHVNPIPGPDDIARRELPNGLVVLARENFNAQSVVISGILPTGAAFDADATAGLASFTADALLYGTANRSFEDIHEMGYLVLGLTADEQAAAIAHAPKLLAEMVTTEPKLAAVLCQRLKEIVEQ